MNATKRTTAVGVFTDHVSADQAIADLKKAGFRDDQIGVIGKDWRHSRDAASTEKGSHVGEGALAGVAAGAGTGALVGLGILGGLIPAIGPVIAGGALSVILANAAGGAAIAGIVGALVGLGIPENEAHYYENEAKSGRYIVTVKADSRYDDAMAILRRHGGYDQNTAPACSAAMTEQKNAACATASGVTHAAADQKFQLHEEQLHAHKQQAQAGEVRVHKEVTTEHKTIDVPVQREEVVIERHAASGKGNASNIRAGEEIRIPVMEEQVRVDKTAVVKEEVTVGKRKVHENEQVSGDVRKEELRVEREGDVNVHARGTNVNDKNAKNRK